MNDGFRLEVVIEGILDLFLLATCSLLLMFVTSGHYFNIKFLNYRLYVFAVEKQV